MRYLAMRVALCGTLGSVIVAMTAAGVPSERPASGLLVGAISASTRRPPETTWPFPDALGMYIQPEDLGVGDVSANDQRPIWCAGLMCPGSSPPKPEEPAQERVKESDLCMSMTCGLPIMEPVPATGTPQSSGPLMCGLGPAQSADPFVSESVGMLLLKPAAPDPTPETLDPMGVWSGGGQIGNAGWGPNEMMVPPGVEITGSGPGYSVGDAFYPWSLPIRPNPAHDAGQPAPTPFKCAGGKDMSKGPASPSSSSNPVEYATGHKLEFAVDLVVPLPGRDFELARSYTSDYDTGNPNLVGDNWQLNTTVSYYTVGGTGDVPEYIYVMMPGGGHRFTHAVEGGSDVWLPDGPSAQRITKSYVDVGTKRLPVYRLASPGDFDQHILRANSSSETGTAGSQTWEVCSAGSAFYRPGYVLSIQDPYGNSKLFEYAKLETGVTNSFRLSKIYLNGDSTSNAAVVEFTWITDPYEFNVGRLRQVEVKRGSAVVGRVEYSYRREANGSLYSAFGHADTGTPGDLIQVATFQPIDRGDSTENDDGNWHVAVTHYRYHDGIAPEEEEPIEAVPGTYVFRGKPHQLKAVINAAEIEIAAQRWSQWATGLTGLQSVLDFATNHLLTKGDDDECFEDGATSISPLDLAAKVVEEYESDYEEGQSGSIHRVQTQYLLSSCGCSGSAQGIRLSYSYFDWPSVTSDGSVDREMQIVEQVVSGGEWTPVRKRTVDMAVFEKETGEPAIHLVRTTVLEASNGGESPPVRWVWHVDYDTSAATALERRRVKNVYRPGAIASYSPTTGGSVPSVTLKSNPTYLSYGYNSASRLETVALIAGSATNQLTKIQYNGARPWLMSRIDTAAVEGISSISGSTSADALQTVLFTYEFWSGTDAVKSVQTSVEAGTEAENGPTGTGSSAKWFHSFALFDERGRNDWTKQSVIAAETGSLSGLASTLIKRTFPSGDKFGYPTAVEVNTADAPPSGRAPSGTEWSTDRNADGGSLRWSYAYDAAGRIASTTSPGGIVTRFTREARELRNQSGSALDGRPGIRHFALVTLPHYYVPTGSSAKTAVGAARVTWVSAAGEAIAMSSYLLESATSGTGWLGSSESGDVFSGYDFKLPDLISGQRSRRTVQHNVGGQVVSETTWHDLSGTSGLDGGGRYISEFTYDDEGRLLDSIAADGTRTRSLYDSIGRPCGVQEGVSIASLLTTREYFFDGGTPTERLKPGNGLLTEIREYTGETSGGTRVTTFSHDARDRLVKVQAPIAPHLMYAYDNLGRRTKVAVFCNNSSGVPQLPASDIDASASLAYRLSYSELKYSQNGTMYCRRSSLTPALLPSDGAFGGWLEWHQWNDSTGRVLAEWGPNQPARKFAYDGIGRLKARWTTDRGGDAAPGASGAYDDVQSVAGDVVYEKESMQYESHALSGSVESYGVVELATRQQRHHSTGESLKGDFETSGGPAGIAIFTAFEFDESLRLVRTRQFGTNSASGFVASSSPPTASGTPKVWSGQTSIDSEYLYNSLGQFDRKKVWKDGVATVGKTIFDDAGRVRATIENYVDGSVAWSATKGRWEATGLSASDPDEDRVTSVVYHLTSSPPYEDHVVHVWDSGQEAAQVTRYVYGVTAGSGSTSSLITSNSFLASVQFPDESTGQPGTTNDLKRFFSYNLQGEQRSRTDQLGVTHKLSRDGQGRVTQDLVVATNGALDNWADRIDLTYDTEKGWLKAAKTLSGTTVKNAIEFTYGSLGEIAGLKQDPDGDIETGGTTKTVSFAYETASATGSSSTANNYMRPSSTTYPSGDVLALAYDVPSVSTADSRISRIRRLSFAGTERVRYSMLGMDSPARTDYVDADVELDYSRAHDGTRSTSGYPGLDRFGRQTRHIWFDGAVSHVSGSEPTIPPIVELVYEHDTQGSITKRFDGRYGGNRGRDMRAEYDMLDRLTLARRGNYSDGSSPTWSEADGGQRFTYDFVGNLEGFDTDLNHDNNYVTANDEIISSDFNMANEETAYHRTVAGSASSTFNMTHDAAGNLLERDLSSTAKYKFVHDPWGRLSQVYYVVGATNYLRSEYRYNALGHRCLVDRCTDTDQTQPINERRRLYYSAGWQLLEEQIDNTSPYDGASTDRVVQNVWGMRYIDDLVMQRQNNNVASDGGSPDYTDTGDRTSDYALSDLQFSVVALVAGDGTLVQRLSYDAFGEARHQPARDINGDGAVDATDWNIARGAQNKSIGQTGYNPDADWDRNGTVSSTDVSQFGSANYVAAARLGQLAPAGTDFNIGFGGYVFNSETGIYTVRFRHYDPSAGLGRWLERDPAGYVDGGNLYEYVQGDPLDATDPYGLLTDVSGAKRTPSSTPIQAPGRKLGLGRVCPGDPGFDRIYHEWLCNGGDRRLGPPIYDEPWTESWWYYLDEDHLREWVHGALDAAGWIPGIGDAADLVNATLYLLEGDYENAAYSAISIIPVLGDAIGKGAKLACKVTGMGCFEEGTLIATDAGLVPIESLRVGDRVLSEDSDQQPPIIPSDWRKIELTLRQPGGVYESVEITLLRPLAWVEETGCQPQSLIWLELREMGLAGWADVHRISACPEIQDGPGAVVLATTARLVSLMCRLKFGGGGECLSLTPTHQIFSTTRQAWRRAAELEIGERVASRDGERCISEADLQTGTWRVYNLEIERRHRFFVGSCGVLAHNVKPCVIAKRIREGLEGVGHYTVWFSDGTRYHGKGSAKRAMASGRRYETGSRRLVDVDWKPAKNDFEAFKGEARRIKRDGGILNEEMHNIINSPGAPYIK